MDQLCNNSVETKTNFYEKQNFNDCIISLKSDDLKERVSQSTIFKEGNFNNHYLV